MQFPGDNEEFFYPAETVDKEISVAKFKAKASSIFGDLKLDSTSTLKFESADSYDYWRDPSKWQKYTLEDTSVDDVMMYANAATETRRIIELDKLRTKLRDLALQDEMQGISTLLDEEEDVFSLQSIKKCLPSVEVGAKPRPKVKTSVCDNSKLSNLRLDHLSLGEHDADKVEGEGKKEEENIKRNPNIKKESKQKKLKSFRQSTSDYN